MAKKFILSNDQVEFLKNYIKESELSEDADLNLSDKALYIDDSLIILYNPDIIDEIKQMDIEKIDKGKIYGVIEIDENDTHNSLEVKNVFAKNNYGAIMYLLAMNIVGKKGLKPYSHKITDEAKNIWKNFYDGKGSNYVEKEEIDNNQKEDFLNQIYYLKKNINTKKAENTHKKLFNNDKYGELKDTLIEFADTLLRDKVSLKEDVKLKKFKNVQDKYSKLLFDYIINNNLFDNTFKTLHKYYKNNLLDYEKLKKRITDNADNLVTEFSKDILKKRSYFKDQVIYKLTIMLMRKFIKDYNIDVNNLIKDDNENNKSNLNEGFNDFLSMGFNKEKTKDIAKAINEWCYKHDNDLEKVSKYVTPLVYDELSDNSISKLNDYLSSEQINLNENNKDKKILIKKVINESIKKYSEKELI